MEIVYAVCAAVGGAIFAIQLVLSLAGADGHDGSLDHGLDPMDHGSSGLFGVLSFRTVVAALAFFGLAGLGGQTSGWSTTTTFVIALLTGAVALYGVYWIGVLLSGLQSDETADPKRSVGCTGSVYLRIPAGQGGVGKVQISQQGRTMEYAAVTQDEELAVGESIVVVAYVGADTVEVARQS